MKTGAVILAAGHKSSLNSFQPMLPMGNTTVIKRIIRVLKQAGAEPIVVITGRNAKELEKHIGKTGVICLRNDAYDRTQMFDSIRLGLNYVEDLCDRVLLLPVKFPMLLPETLEKIMAENKEAVCPVYEGRRGHPILLGKQLIPKILSYQGERGLRGALRQPEIEAVLQEITVADNGIITAIESDEDIAACTMPEKIKIHSEIKLCMERDEIFFGPDTAQFLQLISHTGSMQTACRQMNISYSKGWKTIKLAEKQLGYPLLITQSGGSEGGFSELTPKAADFLQKYLSIEKELKRKNKELFELYFSNNY